MSNNNDNGNDTLILLTAFTMIFLLYIATRHSGYIAQVGAGLW